MQRLRSLVRNEIPEAEARQVYRLIYSDIKWHDAYQQVLLEEARRHHPQP